MIIHLEIPDSFADQKLTVVAGNRELVAQKLPWDDFWKVKTVRCNFCGECCMGLSFKNWPYPIDEEGHCSKLNLSGPAKGKCSAWDVTFRCIEDPQKENVPECCIEYENQPGEKTV